MSTQAILSECDSAGLIVRPMEDGSLYVDPIAKLTDELRDKLVSNKPQLHAHLSLQKRLQIHAVLERLKNIKPYRSNEILLWHGDPTPAQHQLLKQYESGLLEALRPRALTNREAETIALWLHDIGETSKRDRDYIFAQANSSPTQRVGLLWIADGSPDH